MKIDMIEKINKEIKRAEAEKLKAYPFSNRTHWNAYIEGIKFAALIIEED